MKDERFFGEPGSGIREPGAGTGMCFKEKLNHSARDYKSLTVSEANGL